MMVSDQKILKLSIIVPVYNRPKEIEELLESLSQQTNKDFQIVIVEDGSSMKCDQEVNKYQEILQIKYFFKPNTGPGVSRNYGFERADGNYAVFVDSDCILPPQYVDVVMKNLQVDYADAFGGPDREAENFTDLQKAINYSMTSFFTTGGIRGASEKLLNFEPRSFNMGFSREVFDKTGGFPSVRFAASKAAGEDIDLSITIRKLGYKIRLIQDAFVYHKRRTSLKQFFRQVSNFGYARITIFKRHPETVKILYALPSLFFLGMICLVGLSVFWTVYWLIPIFLFAIVLFVDSLYRTGKISIALLAVATSFLQLIGYGYGFLKAKLGF